MSSPERGYSPVFDSPSAQKREIIHAQFSNVQKSSLVSRQLGIRLVIGNSASAGWALLRIDRKTQARSSPQVGRVLVAGIDEADV